jgi:hypothetical protein
MKIALCLSGQPRFVERSIQSIKENLIGGYDVDVFVHTWIDENGYLFRTDGSSMWNGIMQSRDVAQYILDSYRPKQHLFEKPKKFIPKLINGENPVDYFNTLFNTRCPHFLTEDGSKYYINVIHSMWYSIMMSNLQKELYSKENGVLYDYVVRARFDVTYKYKIHYERLNPNKVYVASQVHSDHIHDFFAVSNNKNMNIYSSLFYNLEYYLTLVSPDWRCGEGVLKTLLDEYNVQYEGLDCINPIIRP